MWHLWKVNSDVAARWAELRLPLCFLSTLCVCVCVRVCVCVCDSLCDPSPSIYYRLQLLLLLALYCSFPFVQLPQKKRKNSMCNVFAAMSSKLPPKIPTKWNWGYVLSADSCCCCVKCNVVDLFQELMEDKLWNQFTRCKSARPVPSCPDGRVCWSGRGGVCSQSYLTPAHMFGWRASFDPHFTAVVHGLFLLLFHVSVLAESAADLK